MSLRWDCDRDGCYKDNCIPDWGWLEGLLPRGCRPTDIDGLVEIDKKFLVLEWKSHDAALLLAQKLTFERLTVLSPDILVVVMYAATTAHDSLREIQFIRNGKTHDKVPCTSSEFAERYRRWGGGEKEDAVAKCTLCGGGPVWKDGVCEPCYWAEQGWQSGAKDAVV